MSASMESDHHSTADNTSLEAVDTERKDGGNALCVETAVREMIKRKQNVMDRNFDAPFFLGDRRRIKSQYKKWKNLLPRVDLFYAVKCCGEPPALKLLADMGASFDCASLGEIETMLNLGVDASRIIFAHTVKPVSSLQFASDNNVSLMTFDNEDELEKIKKHYPEGRLVIRLRCRESTQVIFNIGLRFGCRLEDAECLLLKAQTLQLNVVGVCFHLGSGVSDPVLYTEAIRDAHAVFQVGRRVGFNFHLMDIGGGFLDNDETAMTFETVAKEINSSLDYYFPPTNGVKIIAEPGRFLVTSAYTWALPIIGKRSSEDMEEGTVYEQGQERMASPRFIYYVNDGYFGASPERCNNIQGLKPLSHKGIDRSMTYSSLVYGPTSAPWDLLCRDISLPELYIGDWLYLENAGAYSMVLASDFNMMPRATCYYVSDELK